MDGTRNIKTVNARTGKK